MAWTVTRTLVLCLAGPLSIHSLAAAAGQPDAGWTVLLDGNSLKGWNVIGDANWTVADGAVQADKGSGFLVTPPRIVTSKSRWNSGSRTTRTAGCSFAVPIRKRSTR